MIPVIENRALVAGLDMFRVTVNGSLANTIASLLANYTDADWDTIELVTFSGVSANHGRIIQEGTKLIYRSPVGYRGADLFAYPIADGRGGEAVGVMTLNPSSAVGGLAGLFSGCETIKFPRNLMVSV
jgi:hypothetical protein